jgi:hypothetical protein
MWQIFAIFRIARDENNKFVGFLQIAIRDVKYGDVVFSQGDQIGRIFAIGRLFSLGSFKETLQENLATFFRLKKCCINFCRKNVLGYTLGVFSQTHLVTLFSMTVNCSSARNEIFVR